MSNSRRSPSLILDSVGVDHACCWKSHGSLCSFSLTWTIFLSIPSHIARIQSTRSLYFTSSNHLLCVFFFQKGLLQKPPSSSALLLIGPSPWRHTSRLILMHVVFKSLLKIFEYAAKQACKQLQCNKAKLQEPASINGLHIHRALGYASQTNNLLCTLDENIGGHISTLLHCLITNHCREWMRLVDRHNRIVSSDLQRWSESRWRKFQGQKDIIASWGFTGCLQAQ